MGPQDIVNEGNSATSSGARTGCRPRLSSAVRRRPDLSPIDYKQILLINRKLTYRPEQASANGDKSTKNNNFRQVLTARRVAHGLELRRAELVLVQQLVELGAVALGDARRLRHVAVGDLQQLGQVVALELAARLDE